MPRRLIVAAALFAAGCSSGSAPTTIAPTQSVPSVQAASVASASVCHVDTTSSYALLAVAPSAVPGHLSHGDGQPNGPVPGLNGYGFTSQCTIVETSPTGCDAAPPICQSGGECGTTAPQAQCVNNRWVCIYSGSVDRDANGALLPSEVQCSDGKDNNCDGVVDNCAA
jgi:hypothetical protein